MLVVAEICNGVSSWLLHFTSMLPCLEKTMHYGDMGLLVSSLLGMPDARSYGSQKDRVATAERLL